MQAAVCSRPRQGVACSAPLATFLSHSIGLMIFLRFLHYSLFTVLVISQLRTILITLNLYSAVCCPKPTGGKAARFRETLNPPGRVAKPTDRQTNRHTERMLAPAGMEGFMDPTNRPSRFHSDSGIFTAGETAVSFWNASLPGRQDEVLDDAALEANLASLVYTSLLVYE